MVSHCTFRSALRIYCPVSVTIEIQVNAHWKHPASVPRACPESSLRFSSAASPPIPAGLRDPRVAKQEEEGCCGCSSHGPWPKLGLHNLPKNNRESKTAGEGERSILCSHTQSKCAE